METSTGTCGRPESLEWFDSPVNTNTVRFPMAKGCRISFVHSNALNGDFQRWLKWVITMVFPNLLSTRSPLSAWNFEESTLAGSFAGVLRLIHRSFNKNRSSFAKENPEWLATNTVFCDTFVTLLGGSLESWFP